MIPEWAICSTRPVLASYPGVSGGGGGGGGGGRECLVYTDRACA